MKDNLFEGSAHHDRISVDTLFLHSSAYPRKAVLVWLRILFLHSIQMLSGVTVIIDSVFSPTKWPCFLKSDSRRF